MVNDYENLKIFCKFNYIHCNNNGDYEKNYLFYIV